jgi:hypothetical protein
VLVGTTERDLEDVTVIDMAGLALQDLVVALAPRHRKRSRHDPVVSTRQLMASALGTHQNRSSCLCPVVEGSGR